MADDKKRRGAVMQIEFDRQRVGRMSHKFEYNRYTVPDALWHVALGCVEDVMQNGGTFVLVASNEKFTLVQRPDAEDIP